MFYLIYLTWSSMTSQSPSVAIIIYLSSGLKASFLTKGSLETP